MSFTRKTLTSSAWAFSSGYTNMLIAFVGNLLLARILLPEDFGVFSLAISLLAFVTMFTGFGSQEAIIQCRDKSITDLIPTAFWISLAIGAAVAILGVLLGVLVRGQYGMNVASMIVLAALLVPVDSSANAHAAMLRRDMTYRPVALARTTSITVSFLLGIVAALHGMGPWALYIRYGASIVIFWIAIQFSTHYRLERIFNRDAARWIWDFGSRKMVSQINDIISVRYPNLLIGTFIGQAPLGYYSQSFRLALLGQQLTQGSISPILLPLFATVQTSTGRLRYGLQRITYWMSRLLPLPGVFIFLLGEEIVILLYGEKWSVAGHYFETLLVFFVFLPFAFLFKEFLIGSGRIGTVVRVQWAVLGFLIIGVSVSVFYNNVIMVLWTMNLSQVLAVILMAFEINRRITVDWFALCAVPVLAFLITSTVGSWLVSALSETPIGMILSLITLTLVYVALLAVFDHRSLRGEFSIVINGMKRK